MRSIKHADFSLLLLASISSSVVGLTGFAAAPSASWTRAAPVSRAAVTTSRENFFSNDPRAGVLTRLFGTQAAKVKFLRAGYGERKEAVLRWRVAQFRSMVDRTSREIEALQENAAQQQDEVEANAIRARIAVLRRDAGVAETRILQLRTKLSKLTGFPLDASRPGMLGAARRNAEILSATEERSARVLFNQILRTENPWELIRQDSGALLRMGANVSLVANAMKLSQSPTLMPHTAAIVARANKLERFAPGILVAVDGYLPLIEPHLDTILDRLDEIEPFMPFVLDNLDALAPYTGVILDHFDSLILYGDEDGKYLVLLLPFLPTFAPQFDALGPHLALLRPHLDTLLPHLPVIAPYAQSFKKYVRVSANADILLFYFGWILRIKGLRKLVLKLPFLPWFAALMVRVLPRRPVRGRTWDYQCSYEDCDVVQYEARLAASRAIDSSDLDECCKELPPLPTPLPRPLPRARGDDGNKAKQSGAWKML